MTSDAEDTNLLAALGRRWAKTMAIVLAQKVIVGPNIQKLRHHLEPTSNIYGHIRYATSSTDVADSRRQHIDMNCPNSFVRTLRAANISQRLCQSTPRATRSAFTRPLHRQFTNTSRRADKQAADDPNFTSILDAPPQIVRAGKRHGPGIILLGTSFPTKHIHLPQHSQSCSSHPHHGLCPWNMASPAPRLENRTHRQIRRPTRSRPSPPPAYN